MLFTHTNLSLPILVCRAKAAWGAVMEKAGCHDERGLGRKSKGLLPFPFLPRIPFVADPARLPPALSIVLTDREPALLLDIVSGARSLGQRLNKRNTDFNTLC